MPIRCQILRPKCTKFDFCCGSAADPAGGTYSAPPDTLAVCKGPTSKGVRKEGNGKMEGVGGEGKGKKTAGEMKEGRATPQNILVYENSRENEGGEGHAPKIFWSTTVPRVRACGGGIFPAACRPTNQVVV